MEFEECDECEECEEYEEYEEYEEVEVSISYFPFLDFDFHLYTKEEN